MTKNKQNKNKNKNKNNNKNNKKKNNNNNNNNNYYYYYYYYCNNNCNCTYNIVSGESGVLYILCFRMNARTALSCGDDVLENSFQFWLGQTVQRHGNLNPWVHSTKKNLQWNLSCLFMSRLGLLEIPAKQDNGRSNDSARNASLTR